MELLSGSALQAARMAPRLHKHRHKAQASNGGMQEMLRKNGNDWRETIQRGIWIWGQKSQKKWKARSKSGCVVLLEEKIGRV